ncbi:glycosyltransferase family 2 protein [Methanophagales archaeon]|nr:MAG: glycosyltransferase family 2 protein [Methanophagales archaeon]
MLKVKSRNYIIITACKNEADNLPKLIESIEKQTVKPVLWVIVDDGSTDRTPEIIKQIKEKYDWIQSIRLDGKKRKRGLHVSQVKKKGFDFAVEYCMKNEISYEYLCNIDADIILESTFFENLITEFEKDSRLGVASGGIYHFKGDRIVHTHVRESEPAGGNMVIRRKCFEECGGITPSYAYDSTFNTKAKLRKWKTKLFVDVIAIEVRDTSSTEGYWKGYTYKGEAAYYLNFNPFYAIIKGIRYLFIKPYYIGIAYLYGYFNSLIKRTEQINDKEIKHYFRYVRPREVKQYYIEILKTKLKFKINRKKI